MKQTTGCITRGVTLSERICRRPLLFLLLAGFLGSGAACSEPGETDMAQDPGPGASGLVATAPEPPDAGATPAADEPPPLPDVNPQLAVEIAAGVTVIPDPRIDFVPNVGIIEGSQGVLVVDTGLGEANGERVLSFARGVAGNRRLYLTTTHFHPEHNFGASAFADSATLILNAAQAEELQDKGQAYLDLFKTFGDAVAERLEGTRLVAPDQIYSDEFTLDLGGREVILREIPAHTRGDQLIYVPDVDLMFAGDIAETRYFPIMPDADSSAERWVGVLSELEALDPAIVVPGHGAVGGAEILAALRLHIDFMRDRVAALVAAGRDQQAITDLLVPAITAIYPGWDNQVFLPFEIGIIHAEVTGTEPRLPEF